MSNSSTFITVIVIFSSVVIISSLLLISKQMAVGDLTGDITPKNVNTPFIASRRKEENKTITINSSLHTLEGKFTNYSSNESITFDVDYSNYRTMWASWSGRVSYEDYTTSYAVVNFAEYATTLDDFVKKYPWVTIETYGKAESDSTFGDVGRGHFGTFRYHTANFDDDNVRREFLVDAWQTGFGFSVYVKIGLGFEKQKTKLYLWPFIDGYLRSDGAYTRSLDFGLSVRSLTFNPA